MFPATASTAAPEILNYAPTAKPRIAWFPTVAAPRSLQRTRSQLPRGASAAAATGLIVKASDRSGGHAALPRPCCFLLSLWFLFWLAWSCFVPALTSGGAH